MENTRRVNAFIGAMTLSAISAASIGFASHELHLNFGLAVLALAVLTSRMKVKLLGMDGSMSVNLPFLLTAIANLSVAEAVVIAMVSTLVQCWPDSDATFDRQKVAFNVSTMAFASCVASMIFHAGWLRGMEGESMTPGLVLAVSTLFLGQTLPVATIISLTEGKAAGRVWCSLAHLSFPYFVVSAGVSSMVQTVGSHMGWELALAVLPVMYGIHRSYESYFRMAGASALAGAAVAGM